ncbi:PREDICTED: mitotic-spindle organizing protein 1 [Poecilia mexicana]|uniref:Mitotic spindle organizing protein 1 n=1 Tax=Poecilia formosa TaxID=48698 RepID=A0A087YJL3_POEFO|nr:PREDICTED: mitotic-spindle organizing protein 1 isoform X2 [Poecilia formosa]XP_014823702.1 PREDICTED: mitotic-spindle organizing protein 1 [Poecilia mexicana]
MFSVANEEFSVVTSSSWFRCGNLCKLGGCALVSYLIAVFSVTMASAANTNMNAVRETMDVLLEISRLLNTGLDMESLSICVRLCEQGINPEALSAVIKELRKASETLKVSENCTN